MRIVFRDEAERQRMLERLKESGACPGIFGLEEDAGCSVERIMKYPYEKKCRNCWEWALREIMEVKKR